MNMKMTKAVSLLLLSGLVGFGCAQDVEEINRVQNNVTQKSELKGEFYFRSTVVEAPYSSVGYFSGGQNYQLERGVFEIQEKTLFFYRTYEHVLGGETLGASPDIDTPLYQTNDDGSWKLDANGEPMVETYQRRIGDEFVTIQRFVYKGAPLAAFPIVGHLDIKRAYNPLTGEETNVIEENATDREWWQRAHMRVQWGANQTLNHMDTITHLGVFSAPIGEFMDDEFAGSNTAPEKVYNDKGTLDYFQYTMRMTMEAPISAYFAQGYDYIPTCWFNPWFIGQVAECNSERVTFRQAFMRVQPSDYVAWDYDDTLLKKFGYYRIERGSYDATYGTTFSGLSRRIRRFRIWENYALKLGATCETPGGDVHVGCDAGSVCEPIPNMDGMTHCVAEDANDRLDYAQMTPKPIVWYLSPEFPRELVPETVLLAEHWNVPLMDVVTTLKGTPGHDMFILCENNMDEATAAMQQYGLDINNAADVSKAQADKILGAIDGHCLDMTKQKHNGDLRYSFIHSVNEPISYGLYGYGPSSADPLTGEILSANSYMYTPAMKRGANQAMLLIELSTGIRNFWETTYANHISEDMTRSRLGSAQGGSPKSYTMNQAQALAQGMVAPQVASRLAAFGSEPADGNWAQNRMAILAHQAPSLAKSFITDDVKMIHRDPTLGGETGETTEEIVGRLGMHQWAHANGYAKEQEELYESTHREGCKFMSDFADNAIIGIAREYAGEMNARVCEAAQAAPNTVFDFAEFDELQGTCTSAGAWSEDGLLLCQTVTTDAAGGNGLFWTNPCQIGKLKAQLARSVVKLEQQNDYFLNNDYYPPDPVYTDSKHEVVQNSQLALADNITLVREEMITRLWKRIYLGVAEHEVGHSLGLRHNFEGSTDAMNFGSKYWNLKGQFDNDNNFNAYDMFAGETAHQAGNGLRGLQSASVMDYSAKFNDRFEGVGYYDRAAIRFGYGGLVEVFNQTPDTAQFDGYMADPAKDDPSNVPINADFAGSDMERLFKRVHYTNIPELFGNVDALYDRSFVSHTTVADGVTGDGKTEVPYRFCSDELAGRLPTCERWDSGVDSFEMVRNALADYENYWAIWGHWNESALYNPTQYYNRIVRVFGAVRQHMQWWVADYQRFNKNDWWLNNFGQQWHVDPMGGLAGSVAISESVNTLAASFGRPAPGLHGYRGARNVWEPVPFQDNSLYSNTELITQTNCEARQMYPSWDYSGYLPIATKSGAIYERLAAYQMLTDPTTRFLANDKTETNVKPLGNNVGGQEQYLISYFSLFPTETTNLFTSMLGNATDGWGWYMETDVEGRPTNCHRRQLVGPNAGAPQVDDGNGWWAFNPEPEYTFPTTRFRLPMLAAYYGLGLMTNGYDDSFVDATRVYVDGHKAEITPNADAETVSFTDPLSGKTYTAVRSIHNTDIFHPAVHMIEELQKQFGEYASLQDLQENYNYSEYQFVLDKLELLRSMNHAYNFGN